MENILFFQTKEILDNTTLFNQFKNQKIFFSYFCVDQKYYLFLFRDTALDIDFINFIYQSILVIEVLDRKIREFRAESGYLRLSLKIIENGEDFEILETNLQPFFWRKARNILRQNKKHALLEFLYGSDRNREVEEKIKNLQNQVNSLQEKINNLEIDQKKTLNLLSETSKRDEKVYSKAKEGNSTLNPMKAQNRSNFVTLSRISEEEKIEIIKLGFQLQNQGKISLKKYYESTDPNSLFQHKGYSIKHETIRRTKLYQSLKG